MILFAALALLATAAAAEAPPEPAGYRLDAYRAPVPATVAGASAIGTSEAEALWRGRRAVFVDVLPAPRRPEGLPADALWKPVPRRDIPGSLWLPEVGRGALSPALEDYFRTGLCGGDRRRSHAAGGVLLPRRLLDELERHQARGELRLQPALLVSRRHRWLGRGAAADRSGDAGHGAPIGTHDSAAASACA